MPPGTQRPRSRRFSRRVAAIWKLRNRRPVLLQTAEVSALPRDVCPVAARRDAVGGSVASGQLAGEAERRPAGTLGEQALAVGVTPAAPDRSGGDEVEACEHL